MESEPSRDPSLSGYDVTTAGGNLSASGNPVILLGNYSPLQVGSTTQVYINDAVIPDSGLLYVTIHLDIGLKKISDWYKGTIADGNGRYDATNATYGIIKGTQSYTFNFTDGLSDTKTYTSVNEFKRNPGAGGAMLQKDTSYPKGGVRVELWSPTNKLVGYGITDADGVYMINYKHTGKAAVYQSKYLSMDGLYRSH